jgi:hypothetical protein
MPAPGYFQKYSNLHRLASESLMAAIEYDDESQLDDAMQYANDAISCSHNFFELILSKSFINTCEMLKIAFKAQREGRI